MNHPLSDMMTSTMAKIKDMIDVNTVIGDPITTPDGVTLIPISKVSFGFGSGGGDYLVKPFSNHELFLRVDSLIRRYRVYHGKGDAPTVIDALEINRDKGTVCKNGRSVEMTKTEFELLQYLIANRGAAVSARKLYEDVWHEKFLPSSANTVMVHILKLRKKLEDDPANPTLIRTVWGKGYQID